ncbi:hypothetical protein HNQ68_002125 [Pseudochrobactrum saccharolyticum]|uniref:Uncharacterized protein n=1 Tax=Pseudochrobactrum saccharolyticum TaxID=354352 RepID=A0A7W8AKL3_9HYPH|nr:hypothetical protein [Pseudochrobactrum saccharolyticum]KAB0538323.1 hypothetical protein F7P81_11485 [Pseudochrobactrum saccharolyticum]MBB5091584.1 hypothetical protein [Pseudochrobactrum saccharolyticum]
MTVVVDPPSGPVSGASVSAAEWTGYLIDLGGLGWNRKQLGEAVVVDLGDGRYLFALIKHPEKSDYLETVASASIAGLKRRSATEELF